MAVPHHLGVRGEQGKYGDRNRGSEGREHVGHERE